MRQPSKLLGAAKQLCLLLIRMPICTSPSLTLQLAYACYGKLQAPFPHMQTKEAYTHSSLVGFSKLGRNTFKGKSIHDLEVERGIITPMKMSHT